MQSIGRYYEDRAMATADLLRELGRLTDKEYERVLAGIERRALMLTGEWFWELVDRAERDRIEERNAAINNAKHARTIRLSMTERRTNNTRLWKELGLTKSLPRKTA